jgi:non-canonical (house-cleaning) NTP pyrophosphatase
MKIMIGTTSKIKLAAIESVIASLPVRENIQFSIRAYNVESQVPDTPFGNQTIQGAKNRVETLFNRFYEEADLFVGLESGLIERYGNIYEECWCAIRDKNNNQFFGYSSGFMLPKEVTTQMDLGKTHIEVLKILSTNLHLNSKDTWSIYSKGALSRTESIKEAFRNAILSLEYVL